MVPNYGDNQGSGARAHSRRRVKMESPPRKVVAIVVPASLRPGLTADEEISLLHLQTFLGAYDKFLVAPSGTRLKLPGLQTIELSRRYFGSATAYGRLMLREDFYRLFGEYKYILVYHLDALVFRDELLAWCERDLDYIGAPWLRCADTPWVKEPGVGNGGFTLMKVESAIGVLKKRRRMDPGAYWGERFGGMLKGLQHLLEKPRSLAPGWVRRRVPREFRQGLRSIDRVAGRVDTAARRNDLFWGFASRAYIPAFRIPDWQTALGFAFEAAPRLCFELTGGRIPFGCHAWSKFDRSFWEPYLLKAT